MAGTKAKLKKTITLLGYAMITATDENGVDTYGDIKFLPHITGGREWSSEPVGEGMAVFADGLEVYSEDQNEGYNITLTTVAVSDDVEADWYGKTVESDGVSEFADDKEWNQFALFIYENTTDGVGQINFFGKCHVSARRGDSGKTKEDGAFDPVFPEHTIACRPRHNDNFVMKVIKGKQKLTKVPTITRPDTPSASSYINEDDE